MSQRHRPDPDRPTVSVVATVLNERASVGAMVESLLAQTRAPNEIVVVDGGSRDGTPEIIRDLMARAAAAGVTLRLLERPGANISAGRNTAIAAATGAIVACTDAGVRLTPDWLAEIVAPLEDDPEIEVVGGFFAPDPRGAFEVAMGATVLPTLEDVDPATFLPSSRSVAYRRDAWAAVGGYPEWLDYCEDLVFDLALRARGRRFAFRPAAMARYRPRASFGAFFTQYFRYARGDGKADLWRRRHAIRYATYTVAPLVALAGLWYKGAGRWLAWAGLAAGAAAYVRRPYQRLRPWLGTLAPGERLLALALVPPIRLVGDVAKMLGYPVGVFWRQRHRRQ